MILDRIVEQKQEEVGRLLSRGIAELDMAIDPPRGFQRALESYSGVAVIAEAKKASPSKGVIRADFDVVQIASDYEQGGAQAVSVLTDVSFFQGDLQFIPAVRKRISLPVLRKDFIIHEIQIRESRACGADAILLIAAILDVGQMAEYLAMARELGLDVLVETHDEEDLTKALEAGSRLIGINNRNLRDFSVDLETTFRLSRLIPAGIPVVSESAIRGRADMERLAAEKITAALIGETLMRADDRIATLRSLR